jgi:GNAT superfamily N-acetyltransferase
MWLRSHLPTDTNFSALTSAAHSAFGKPFSNPLPNSMNDVRDRIDMCPVRVRASEAERLSEFSSKCFGDTYVPLCRATDVTAHIAKYMTPSAWLKVLTDGKSWVFAGIIDGDWAAYTHLQLAALPAGTTSVPSSAPSVTPIEICRFYVAPRWHGQGVAGTLMKAVFAHAAVHGAESVWLKSWQGNARATAFYSKWNFMQIGSATFTMGEEVQQDYLWQRVLSPRAPDTP